MRGSDARPCPNIAVQLRVAQQFCENHWRHDDRFSARARQVRIRAAFTLQDAVQVLVSAAFTDLPSCFGYTQVFDKKCERSPVFAARLPTKFWRRATPSRMPQTLSAILPKPSAGTTSSGVPPSQARTVEIMVAIHGGVGTPWAHDKNSDTTDVVSVPNGMLEVGVEPTCPVKGAGF